MLVKSSLVKQTEDQPLQWILPTKVSALCFQSLPNEAPRPHVHHQGCRIEAVPRVANAVMGHDGEDRVQAFALRQTISFKSFCQCRFKQGLIEQCSLEGS